MRHVDLLLSLLTLSPQVLCQGIFQWLSDWWSSSQIWTPGWLFKIFTKQVSQTLSHFKKGSVSLASGWVSLQQSLSGIINLRIPLKASTGQERLRVGLVSSLCVCNVWRCNFSTSSWLVYCLSYRSHLSGFGKTCNGMNPPLQCHTESCHCPQTLRAGCASGPPQPWAATDLITVSIFLPFLECPPPGIT